MGQFRMPGHAAQGVAADVSFADVPVAIDSRIVRGPRVVEVNCAYFAGTNCVFEFVDQGFQTIFLTKVVAGGERVRGVKANAQRKLGTGIHDYAQMLEAMANTFSLSRRIFQKNPQLSQVEPADRKLNTVAALANSVSFMRSTCAARMHDQVVDAKQDCPFNFFAKGSTRLLQYEFVGSSEVYEIVAMNDDGCEFSYPAYFFE